jgi:ubiquitin
MTFGSAPNLSSRDTAAGAKRSKERKAAEIGRPLENYSLTTIH